MTMRIFYWELNLRVPSKRSDPDRIDFKARAAFIVLIVRLPNPVGVPLADLKNDLQRSDLARSGLIRPHVGVRRCVRDGKVEGGAQKATL